MIGDTRVWTRDLSICSRMLYHWAISPTYSCEGCHFPKSRNPIWIKDFRTTSIDNLYAIRLTHGFDHEFSYYIGKVILSDGDRVPRRWLQLILAVLHVEKMIGWIVNNFRIERMESIGNHVRVNVRDKAFVKFPSFPLIVKGCFALKGIEETRSSAKTQGDTRVWTRDLSICSRMLYHWAISPYLVWTNHH